MRARNIKLGLIAMLAASAILTTVASTASAAHLSVSEQGFRLTWSALTLEAAGLSIACPITIEGSFERATMVKRAGTVGRINGAAIGTCERGNATILRETLPWSLNYVSFSGTLPAITSVTWSVIGAAWQSEVAGITCLARTEASNPGRGIANLSSSEVVSLRADETARIETGGGFFCSLGGSAHYAGTANVTVAGGSTHPRLTLI